MAFPDLPHLTGLIPQPAEDAILRLRDYAAALEREITRLAAVPAPLTLDQIRRALSATGATPLNVFNLIGAGGLSGTFLSGTHSERLAIAPSTVPANSVFYETDRTALYITLAATWRLLINRSFAVTLGSLPSLTTTDAGFVIAAAAYNRQWTWSGSAWADAPGQDSRGQIVFFRATPSPSTGWALCDGASATSSTATATTTSITTPDLLTANRFLRAAGTAGGTGGDAANHEHEVDYGTLEADPTALTVAVQSGAGTTVAQAAHLHDVVAGTVITSIPTVADDALPPYYQGIPYVRL